MLTLWHRYCELRNLIEYHQYLNSIMKQTTAERESERERERGHKT